MGSNPQVNVVLTAEDQGVAAAIRQLNQELKSLKTQQDSTAASATKAGGAFKNMAAQALESVKLRLANVPGLGGFGSVLALRAYEPVGKELEESAGAIEEKFGDAALAVGGVTAAVVALGVAAAGVTHHMMELAQSIENTAAATGLSATQVQELNEVAREMDIDAGSLQMAFARVQSQMGEFIATGKAAGNGSQYFVRVMNEMGVSLTDAQGKLRPVNDVLADFYDALQKIPDAESRAALEAAAFGTRGRVVAQMFEEARREGMSYRDMLASIDSSGVVIPDSQLDNLMEAKKRWDELTRTLEGYKTELEGVIAYAVTHPLDTAKGFLIGGGMGGATSLITNMVMPERGAGGASAAGNANALIVEQIAQQNEQLEKRLDTLRAGGEMQLQLKDAENSYAAALKSHNTDLAKAYARQVAELKEIIALEGDRRKKKTKPFAPYGPGPEFHKLFAEPGEHGGGAGAPEFSYLPKLTDVMLPGVGSLNAMIEQGQRGIETLDTALGNFGLQRELISDQLAAQKITERQAEQQYLNLLHQELPLLEQKAAIELAGAKASGDPERILKAQEAIRQIQQMALETKKLGTAWRQTFNESIKGTLSQFVDSITSGTRTVGQSFAQLEVAVLRSLENIAEQMIANALTQKSLAEGTKLTDAETAAANVYASVSAIPFVGWALAPAAAAAAFAAVLAFEQGGVVPGARGQAVPIVAHAHEMVLPEDIATGLDRAIRGGTLNHDIATPGDFHATSFQLPDTVAASAGGDVHVGEINLHHNGPDAREVLETELVPRLKDALRAGALPSFG